MTIRGRRQLLGWGALGLGAVALDGCGNLFPWAGAPPGMQDIERLLASLDTLKLRLKSLHAPPERFGIKSGTVRVAEGQATCMRLLTTICSMGTYRDIPESMWREPRVEAHLAEALPEVHSTILGARNHLADMTEDESVTIENALQKDPGLTMRIMDRVDDYATQIDVPVDQRMYLRTATLQLSARFRYEGSKEVTSKLVAQYDRTLAKRQAELAMTDQPDAGAWGDAGTGMGSPDAGVEGESSGPIPSTAAFRTRASVGKLYVATCRLDLTVNLDGREHPVVLHWEDTPCRRESTMTLNDQAPVRGIVRREPGGRGENIVIVELYPLAGANVDGRLSTSAAAIAEYLQAQLATGQTGDPCASKDDCGPLHCVDGRCVGLLPGMTLSPATRRLGSAGESCRTNADCEAGLPCAQGSCRPSRSATMSATTRKVAIVGAWTLIPPICAIGILILLQCLFMVIVTGAISEGGD
jgi:hypothetical protein